MRRALIFGVNGQDGSYLAEQLLAAGWEVHGVIRRSSVFNTARLDHLDPHSRGAAKRLHLHYGDVTDGTSIRRVLDITRPEHVYNLAAMSHVRVSFEVPEYTAEATGVGALRLFEAIRASGQSPRVYSACSSEVFGNAPPPQRESTLMVPRSPYGCAKLFAYVTAINYREAYGMHVSSGILFNHESPRRAETFLSRKVTRAAARIKLCRQDKLFLGNLDARRDWGYAPEYTAMMTQMLERDIPGDYVVATGESHTVREFVDAAFSWHDLDYRRYVEHDSKYVRPTEVDHLLGDASKARAVLGWEPRVKFTQLVHIMALADIESERAL